MKLASWFRSARKSWLRGEDLNLRPSGYEPDELPDCSTPRFDWEKQLASVSQTRNSIYELSARLRTRKECADHFRRATRKGPALNSQVLGSREHDEIADRHILRTSQHEDDGFCHILGAKSRSLGDLSIDFGRIGNSPEFVQNHPGSNGSDAHTGRQQLATETMNERLDRVFGGTIDRFPMDGLMT